MLQEIFSWSELPVDRDQVPTDRRGRGGKRRTLLTYLQNNKLTTVIAGLGRDGKPLEDRYWSVLTKFPGCALHTADEEAIKRFLAAQPIQSLPDTAFAREVSRQLRACLKGSRCHTTRSADIQFVQAGTLHVRLLFDHMHNRFLVHDRWLSASQAVDGLGIARDWDPAHDGLHVPLHVAGGLFADMMARIPADRFERRDDKPADWDRKRELVAANLRLMVTQMMMRTVRFQPGPRLLILSWDAGMSSGWAKNGDHVELHVHESSRCLTHLQDSMLACEGTVPPLTSSLHCAHIVSDAVSHSNLATNDNLPCKNLAEDRKDAGRKPTCQVVQDVWSDALTSHVFNGLDHESEYFAVMVNRSRPQSMNIITSGSVKPERPGPAVPEVLREQMPEFDAPKNSVKRHRWEDAQAVLAESQRVREEAKALREEARAEADSTPPRSAKRRCLKPGPASPVVLPTIPSPVISPAAPIAPAGPFHPNRPRHQEDGDDLIFINQRADPRRDRNPAAPPPSAQRSRFGLPGSVQTRAAAVPGPRPDQTAGAERRGSDAATAPQPWTPRPWSTAAVARRRAEARRDAAGVQIPENPSATRSGAIFVTPDREAGSC